MRPLIEKDLNKVFDNLCHRATMELVIGSKQVVDFDSTFALAKKLLTQWWSPELQKNLSSKNGYTVYQEVANSLEWQLSEKLKSK